MTLMRNPYVFSLLALAVLLLAAAAQEPKKPMPTDEQGLFQYASQHMNRRQWRVAEKSFRLCLEKFPKGKLAAQVHYRLGAQGVFQGLQMRKK